jgi:hypothetical protein
MKPDEVVHTCNASIWEAEARGSGGWGQSEIHSKTVSQPTAIMYGGRLDGLRWQLSRYTFFVWLNISMSQKGTVFSVLKVYVKIYHVRHHLILLKKGKI